MTADPWSRPSLEDLRRILDSIDDSSNSETRTAERLELSVPAEITTQRGNTISAMTREISRSGIGLVHRGSVNPGQVTLRMASETREFEYQVIIDWCTPTVGGMFMSGGHFVGKEEV